MTTYDLLRDNGDGTTTAEILTSLNDVIQYFIDMKGDVPKDEEICRRWRFTITGDRFPDQ